MPLKSRTCSQRSATVPRDPAWVELVALLARLKSFSGDNEAALDLADRALSAAERTRPHRGDRQHGHDAGVSLAYLNRNREAMLILPGVLMLAETNGLVVTELRARLNISQFCIVDDPSVSIGMARVGMEKAQRLGFRVWETLLAGNAIMAALQPATGTGR